MNDDLDDYLDIQIDTSCSMSKEMVDNFMRDVVKIRESFKQLKKKTPRVAKDRRGTFKHREKGG